jgi:hypothetical protein
VVKTAAVSPVSRIAAEPQMIRFFMVVTSGSMSGEVAVSQ